MRGCGEMKSKKEMMRVLKTAENEIVLDTTGRKTEEALIYAFVKNVCKMPQKQGTGTFFKNGYTKRGLRKP